MSVIYMRHDIHGTKVACSEPEAVADEAKGWKRYEIAALLKPTVNALAVQAKTVDELAELRKKYAAKFGAKPHHKKSAETLKRELEAA